MDILPEYVNDLLTKIASDESLSDVTIEVDAGCKHGENFFGVLHRVTLSGQRNGHAAYLHLVCKLSPTNQARRQEFLMSTMFKREVLMYSKILPLLAKFQRDKGLRGSEGFSSFARCYAAVADEKTDQFVVILEDLTQRGFTMLPKEQPIPAAHAYLAIGQLAKLHAVSFAIKDQQPKIYEEMRDIQDLIRDLFRTKGMSQIVEMSYDRAIAVIHDERQKELLKEFKANATALLDGSFAEGVCDPFGVMGHGDFWLNNIMFRHSEEVMSRLIYGFN